MELYTPYIIINKFGLQASMNFCKTPESTETDPGIVLAYSRRTSASQVEIVVILFFLIPSICGKNLRVKGIKGINIKMDSNAVINELLADS